MISPWHPERTNTQFGTGNISPLRDSRRRTLVCTLKVRIKRIHTVQVLQTSICPIMSSTVHRLVFYSLTVFLPHKTPRPYRRSRGGENQGKNHQVVALECGVRELTPMIAADPKSACQWQVIHCLPFNFPCLSA